LKYIVLSKEWTLIKITESKKEAYRIAKELNWLYNIEFDVFILKIDKKFNKKWG